MTLNFPASPSNGDVYDNFVYDATKGAWKIQSVLANVTSQLFDVSSDTPADNQILIFNNSTGEYEPVNLPTSSTTSLADVSSTTPTNNQILIFNNSTGEYEPGNLPETPSPIGLILALG